MLEKLYFITPTLMRVLETFLSDPQIEVHEREVMRRTGVSKGSANKMLRRLAEHDLLKRERRGRMVFYRLAMDNPVVRQFKILLNVYQLKPLMDEIKEDSRRIMLFGSCSEGTDVQDSDVDLFVLATDKQKVRKMISHFNVEADRRIAPIILDANEVVKLREEDEPLYERIQRGILLWERE